MALGRLLLASIVVLSSVRLCVFAGSSIPEHLELDKDALVEKYLGNEKAALLEIENELVKKIGLVPYRIECDQTPNPFIVGGVASGLACGLVLVFSGLPFHGGRIAAGSVFVVASVLGIVIAYHADAGYQYDFEILRENGTRRELLARVKGLSRADQEYLSRSIYVVTTKRMLTFELFPPNHSFMDFRNGLSRVQSWLVEAANLGVVDSIQHFLYRRNLADLSRIVRPENYKGLGSFLRDRIGRFSGDDIFLAHISWRMKEIVKAYRRRREILANELRAIIRDVNERTPDEPRRFSALRNQLAGLDLQGSSCVSQLEKLANQLDHELL
jgi:hypothetical protein